MSPFEGTMAIMIRPVAAEERERIREMHVKNHLDASVYSPETLDAQIADLPTDFPHFYRQVTRACSSLQVDAISSSIMLQ